VNGSLHAVPLEQSGQLPPPAKVTLACKEDAMARLAMAKVGYRCFFWQLTCYHCDVCNGWEGVGVNGSVHAVPLEQSGQLPPPAKVTLAWQEDAMARLAMAKVGKSLGPAALFEDCVLKLCMEKCGKFGGEHAQAVVLLQPSGRLHQRLTKRRCSGG
jgi:hypothetical protein